MNKLKQIISDYTGIEPNEIDDKMSLSGDFGLDSFSVISMISEIEDNFNVSISENEMTSLQTFDDLCSYLNLAY